MPSIKLIDIPADIYCILLQEQAKIKGIKKIGMFGLERTIYAIIREHKRCEQPEVITETPTKKKKK